jgi:hypothetical protein
MEAGHDASEKQTIDPSIPTQDTSRKQNDSSSKAEEAKGIAVYPYPPLLPIQKVIERHLNAVSQKRRPFPFHIWKIVREQYGEDPVNILRGLQASGDVYCEVNGVPPFPNTWNEVSRIEEATNKDICLLYARGLHQAPVEDGKSMYECTTFGCFRKEEGMQDWRLVVTKGNVNGTMSAFEFSETLELEMELVPTTAEYHTVWQFIKDWDDRERESWRVRHLERVETG